MEIIRQLSTWTFARWARLLISIVVLMMAWDIRDTGAGVLGVFLLYQAVFNVGCWTSQGCGYTPPPDGLKDQQTTFEEIK